MKLVTLQMLLISTPIGAPPGFDKIPRDFLVNCYYSHKHQRETKIKINKKKLAEFWEILELPSLNPSLSLQRGILGKSQLRVRVFIRVISPRLQSVVHTTPQSSPTAGREKKMKCLLYLHWGPLLHLRGVI